MSMSEMQAAKIQAQVEKMKLKNQILMYQATRGNHVYTPGELQAKTLKQLQKIWDEIERGSGHA